MKVIRSILALVVGIMIAPTVIMGVHLLGHQIYPPPADFDPSKPEALEAYVRAAPVGALAMIVVAWQVGALVGGLIAALIAGFRPCVHAGVIGGVVLLGTVIQLTEIRHPDWVIVAGLLLPLPVSLIAGQIVAMLFSSTPTPPANGATNP